VRGRTGVQKRLKPAAGIVEVRPSYSYVPYSGEDIGQPPLVRAGEGRLNRAHVSILYLASDAETAIAELRPHPGHLVSTATFRLVKPLLVADFATKDVRHFLSDSRLELLRTILSISDILNLPVQPEQGFLYGVTQLFSDAIRECGFDAVTFKSSVGPGINLVCFRSGSFEMEQGSERVHHVSGLRYEIEQLDAQPQTFDPKKFSEDKNDPLSTVLHGIVRSSH
jgi:hypothetical protein